MIANEEKIFVAGHRGLVGSALVRRLNALGYQNLLLRTRQELDLTEQNTVREFLADEKPHIVFDAAARVGGIMANNTSRADFIFENLQIQNNLIWGSHLAGVERFLFLGSSCIYPRECPQPIKEDFLLSGPLEQTNQPYAIAKIAGIELCDSLNRQYGRKYQSLMPTNLFGPGDNFDLSTSHVLPALIRRFHEARLARADHVTVWGSGKPCREFLFVDDLADACVFVMNNVESTELINVGTGRDISILNLARLVADVTQYEGEIRLDTSKPDGTMRKLLDVSRLSQYGWRAKTGLRCGIEQTYKWYCDSLDRCQ